MKRVLGLTVECAGLHARVGDLCRIEGRALTGEEVLGEVVGFDGDRHILMPLSSVDGIGPECDVTVLGRRLDVSCGPALLGRVIDGLGRPIDGRGPLPRMKRIPLLRPPRKPLARTPIRRPLETGIRVLDGLMTLGWGQRVGLFSGSGVGKSMLLAELTRSVKADVVVLALIGERGREVREFVEEILGPEGIDKAVVVVAASDTPPLQRLKSMLVATTIVEAFVTEGADAILLVDSVTRFAHAAREIGLAAGEPPGPRGYPPSLFALLPTLTERIGSFEAGCSSAIYTVLVEGDDLEEPLADAMRSIMDGHIVLSRELAAQNHFPAVDVLNSVSRIQRRVVGQEHAEAASVFRSLYATYKKAEDLIAMGAYKAGADPLVDRAVNRIGPMREFLRQSLGERSKASETLSHLLNSVRSP